MADERGVGLFLIGLGACLLWLLWRCWRGRWRRWVGEPLLDAFVLGLGPPVGMILLGVGLTMAVPEPVGPVVGTPVLLIGLACAPVGVVVMFLPRRWWGPRWYRQLTDEQVNAIGTISDRTMRRLHRQYARSGEVQPVAGAPGHHLKVARSVGQGYSTAFGGLLGARVGEYADDPPYVIGRTWREVAGWRTGSASDRGGDGR